MLEFIDPFPFSDLQAYFGLLVVLGMFVLFLRETFPTEVVALGGAVSFLAPLLAVTFSTIAVALPISIGGLGVGEASLTTMLIICGVSTSVAGTASLLVRAFIWLLSLVGGFLFLMQKPSPAEKDDS